MKVKSTMLDLRFAMPSHRPDLAAALPNAVRIAKSEANKHKKVNRKLVIAKCCPCCHPQAFRNVPKNAVLVSPLKGILCPKGFKHQIHCVDMDIPHSGDDGIPMKAKMVIFEQRWRETVKKAIREAGDLSKKAGH